MNSYIPESLMAFFRDFPFTTTTFPELKQKSPHSIRVGTVPDIESSFSLHSTLTHAVTSVANGNKIDLCTGEGLGIDEI